MSQGREGRKQRSRRTSTAPLIVDTLGPVLLRELHLERGLTLTEIARRHGCSKQYVSILCRRHGL